VIVSTSLNLQALLKSAVARSGLDRDAPLVTGLTPTARALYLAAAAQAMPQGVVLLVLPGDRDLEQVVGDTRFFFAALSGVSSADAERLVLPFPSHEVDPYRGMQPHAAVTSARARALHAVATGRARILVASAAALLPRMSAPARLLAASIDLRPGQEVGPGRLADLLVDAGFSREDPADEHGEFALRGGIVDIYPASDTHPVRVEFVGDTIESLRTYDPGTQRSVRTIDQLGVVPLREVLPEPGSGMPDLGATLVEFLAGGRPARVIVAEPDEVASTLAGRMEQLRRSHESAATDPAGPPPPERLFADPDHLSAWLAPATRLMQLGIDEVEGQERAPGGRAAGVRIAVRSQPTPEMHGRIAEWVADIRRRRDEAETTLFIAATPGRAERTVELLKEYEIFAAPIERAEDARYAAVLVAVGGLSRGVRLPEGGLQIYAEPDVFDEERRGSERRGVSRAFLSDLRDLKVSDLVVHVDHGIGMFVGLRRLGVGDTQQEFLELRYAGDDKLFVPVERLDLVQKYTGAAGPPLDRLGGTTWERTKTRVRKVMRDMAGDLLKLYAARKAVGGHAFSPDSHWQQEFEDAFEYELTPDQQTAVADIKRDMEAPAPMDRLLCGDVGYGKTEVAMRAAFKAVMDGKQVAVLAPTTVLAFQHEKTLRERFAGFPVRVEMVSRFRTKAEQKQALADLAAGKVDIIVGTHRLLSKDVVFRDLGLLVVDEEQRFGVAHKEKIKQLRHRVDVLTMTATPIPRTLNMSLVGIRDMSIIETPPKDRLAIQTNVVKFDQQVIRRAIGHELERGGQVYFVHNRVESIFSIGALLARLVPEARVVVGHGQMTEDALERAMLDFVARKYDVLLATTIVENGLDIPNANTIIVNRADRYGLSQLYQLRGRVGRSDRPAYAYLLIPPEDNLSPVAKKRLAAIKEFSDLGSGFRVAALDLEIRGAGNLLGGEQSGHIEAIGFEMYMKLLDETVRELKGEEIEEESRAAINLGVDLRIDESYIVDMNQRLMLYKRIAGARREEEIEQLLEETRDRYGPLPDSVLNLADYGRIRVLAGRLGIESVDRDGASIVLRFRAQARVDPVRLVALVGERPDLTLVPPAALRLGLQQVADGARGRGPKPGARSQKSASAPSWWTARARAGQVTPGFSKAEILKPVRDDPRAAGGVFEQVGALLAELVKRM
jgi:transcription-repair coupling factor (superfamily II helicase)